MRFIRTDATVCRHRPQLVLPDDASANAGRVSRSPSRSPRDLPAATATAASARRTRTFPTPAATVSPRHCPPHRQCRAGGSPQRMAWPHRHQGAGAGLPAATVSVPRNAGTVTR
jgi:hypothetical protein